MKKNELYILGSGGMAREAYQYYVRTHGPAVVKGFIIEQSYWESGKILHGLPVFSDKIITSRFLKHSMLLSAIGSPLKSAWIKSLQKRGASFTSLVDSSVGLNSTINIGNGSIVAPGVILTDSVSIGKHAIINVSATLNHDVKIGDFSHIAPGVHIAGNVTIGKGTWVGIGASIIQGVSIGNNCYIAAGAVVVDNLNSGYLYMGVPAKPARKLTISDWNNLI